MRNGHYAWSGLAALAALGGCAASSASDEAATAPVASSAPADERCAALARLGLDKVTIESAALVLDGAALPGAMLPNFGGMFPGGPVKGLPDLCRVTGTISTEPGSRIGFEVWLPTATWNGRFLSAGNGGFAGDINYPEMISALAGGHATANSDTGHQGNAMLGDWAKGNPVAVRDYGYRAVHETTVAAKALIRAFYGKPQDKAYFSSCSNGGRQGLMEASRYPGDYDGIVAGAPAAPFSKLAMSMIWSQQVQAPPGAAIAASQAKFIGEETVRQCDAVDGLSDGLIDDPRACKLDFAKFSCAQSQSAQCLSAAQTEALRKSQTGPSDARGRTIAHPYLLSGGEAGVPIAFMGWENWITAKGSVSPLGKPAAATYPESLLRDFPPQPIATVETFDWDRHPAIFAEQVGSIIDPMPKLKLFFDRGGKLIIWHGWSDAAIPALNAIDFYNAALRSGGPRAADSMRLFLIPGQQHCGGGPGASAIGQMAAPRASDVPEGHIGMAMRQWVEAGRAPQSVIGVMGSFSAGLPSYGAPRERLHCAYPKRARLEPGADPDKASSYRCR